jgi:DNA gyrase subunit A
MQSDDFITIEQEMKQSYMDYAMSVIIGRALPDARDGLKPVQRRVLYAMLSEGLISNRKHSKCAGVVGEVLKKFHPHGDSSVYDALVRLAQSWVLRYPLVDGQGNFGDIDGDPAAAYRYTECRLTSLAERLLDDIDKDTVDFTPNFDDTTEEPLVLPSTFPTLLVNGADGIAVGMATHMPPHNIGETIDAVIALVENPHISTEELLRIIPGPDFPTGGQIVGTSGITSAYATGRGMLQIRGSTHTETLKNNNREVEAIVITEIPYQVNKSRLIEKIAELHNSKLVEGIARLRDESDRKGMRIVIELKRDVTSSVVLNQLYKSSPLQVGFGIINLAIVEGKPIVLTLKRLIECFVDHRHDVVVRRTKYLLNQSKARIHILDGLRVVLLHIDDVIQLIKGSDSPAEAKAGLSAKYELSDIQSQAILELRLQKLTGLERLAIEKEHEELTHEIERLEKILADSKEVDNIIVSELKLVRDKFADKRRTEIVPSEDDFEIEDLIEDQEMAVTISHQGYVKRIPLDSYKAQKRGGKGVLGASSKDEDFTENFFVASSLSKLLVFTTLGRLYRLPVYKIPESSRVARGRAIVNLLELKSDEQITAFLPVRDFDPDKFIMMVTKRGVAKKVQLSEFSRERKGGVIATSLDQGDSLIGVALTSGKDQILLVTKTGMSLRFDESDVRHMGRLARGVKAIELEDLDDVVGMTVVTQNEGSDRCLFSVCENGFGKRTLIESYRLQRRGGKGIIDIQTSSRNGMVVGGFAVSNGDGAMLITSSGKVIRIKIDDISVVGRNTQGVRLINIDEGEKVAAIAHFIESDEELPETDES